MGMFGGNLSAKPSSSCLPAPSKRPLRHRPSRIHQLGRWGWAGPAGKGTRYDAHRYKQSKPGYKKYCPKNYYRPWVAHVLQAASEALIRPWPCHSISNV
eukprot:scaffold10029_cov52-Phaeocystis_antarctica.AAC.2